jgi:SlyX protein
MTSGDTNHRLDELESRLAFQDDVIEKLDSVVTRQNLEILRLTASLNDLREALKEVAGSVPGSAESEAPPHY